MTCKKVERLLTEDIRAVEKAEVQTHIRCCCSCEKLYRELLSIKELSPLLRESKKAPVDFTSQVYRRLSKPSLWQIYGRPALSVSLAILVAVGFLWIREVQQQTTEKAMVASERILEAEEPFSEPVVDDLQVVDGDHVEGPYVDVILSSPSEPEYVLRLPSRIKVRTTNLHHDIYLNYASY